jgi:TolA-binding protein
MITNMRILLLLIILNLVHGSWPIYGHVASYEFAYAQDQDFEQAIDLFQKGQYAPAQYYLDSYVRAHKKSLQAIEAQYYACLCAAKMNQVDAEARFKQFIAVYPDHPKAALAYYELGNLYVAKLDYKQSIHYYLLIDIKQLDQNMQNCLYYQLAYACLNEKDFERALTYFNQLKNQASAYSYAANYYAGYIAFKHGDYDAALEDLKRAGVDDAYKTVVPYLISEVLYHQKRFKELVAYSASLSDMPDPIKNQEDIILLTAEAHFFLHEYPAAAQAYEAYIGAQEDTPNPEVIYRLAYALYKSNEDYKALKYFQDIALENTLVGQLASYYLGALYLKTDQKKMALLAFDQARQKLYDRSVQLEAALQYAKINYDLGNWSRAIVILEEIQKEHPASKHSTEITSLLSTAYVHTNNYDLAIDYIEKLPKPTTTTRKIYQRVTLYKGQQCFNTAAYDQAHYWFTKSLEYSYDPTLAVQAHLWLGESLSAKQNYTQAINHYQFVLAKHKLCTDLGQQALYGLAYAYFNTQAYEQALTKFSQYIKQIGPEVANKAWVVDAQVRMADCLYILKDYQKALELYDQVLNYYPAHTHYQKALIYAAQGKAQEAEKNWLIIHEQYQHSAYYESALFEYARIAFKMQAYPVAIERFTQFIQNRPQSQLKPDAFLDRAIAYVNLNQYQQAAEDYKFILQTYPKHPHAASAILELPKLLVQLGEADQLPDLLASYEAANPSTNSGEYITFEVAKTIFYNQSYEQAIIQLHNFIRKYPHSSSLHEAYFLLAEAYYRSNDYSNALANYAISSKAIGADFQRKALLRIASIAYEQNDFQTALNYYEQLQLSASNKKEHYAALEGIMKASYVLRQYEKSKQAASLIKEQGNIVINAIDQASLYLGKTAMQQGEHQKAIAHFKQLLASGKDAYAAEAHYLLAKMYYEAGDYHQSLELLFELNKQFATHPRWVNESFLLIADNYLALGELFQAKATLQSIIAHASDAALVKNAQQKLAELNQQAEMQKETSLNQAIQGTDLSKETVISQEDSHAQETKVLEP